MDLLELWLRLVALWALIVSHCFVVYTFLAKVLVAGAARFWIGHQLGA